MKIDFVKKESVVILSIDGSLDASVADQFKSVFENYAKENSNFVLDMRKVSFIDSTGLGKIVSALRTVSEKKGDLKIAGISDEVMMVFQITRAFRIFDIYDDVNEAVNSF